jgi:tetratricopeptide (TPR) repeat protein
MEEYKKALALRKEGKFAEGLGWLQKANDAGNLYAKFELYKIYIQGGWGVYAKTKHNTLFDFQENELLLMCHRSLHFQSAVDSVHFLIERAKTIEEQVLLSSIIAKSCNWHDRQIMNEWLQKGAEGGCAECLVQLWLKTKDWNHLVAAYAQRNTIACKEVFFHYWKQRYYKEAFDIYNACKEIQREYIISLRDLAQDAAVDLEAKYFIGKSIPDTYTSKAFEQARNYYFLRHLRVKKAVIQWMAIAKRKGLYKDVARIIGKLVFASREIEGVWDKKQKSAKSRLKRAKIMIKL